MKRKLYIPLLTLGLSAVLITACTQQVQAHHRRTQRIAAPQVTQGGTHHTSIHVNGTQTHRGEHTYYYNVVPERGDYQLINQSTYLVAAQSASVVLPENSITEAQARSIALEHAGVKEVDIIYLNSHLDYDDGVAEYEVEFCTGSKEYDYDIKAADGTILSFDYELEGGHTHTMSGSTITPPAGCISEADAKKIALEHAGVKETDITFSKIKLEYDDGVLQYEVEFYVGNEEYDYELDAAAGTILSYDYDIEDDFNVSNQGSASAAISEADARKLVLAKIPGATEAHIRDFEADMDDGRLTYEGEVKYNGMEYEFEIDAATGTFLEWDVDRDD